MEHPEPKEKLVPVSVRMDAELHGELSDFVHHRKRSGRKTSIGAEIQAAIRERLRRASEDTGVETTSTSAPHNTQPVLGNAPPSGSTSNREADLTEEERSWIKKLLHVLRSENQDFVRAVTDNLKIFAGYCDHPSPPTGEKKAPVDPAAARDRGGSTGTRAVAGPHLAPPGDLQAKVSRLPQKAARQVGPERKRTRG